MRDFQTLEVNGFAVIDGVVVDIDRYEASFPVNSIPSGSVTLSLGRNPRGDLAKIHKIFAGLTFRLPIQVYLKVTPGSLGVQANWPKDFFLAFDGFTTGSAMERDPSNVGLTLGMTHWLDELTHGSMLFQTSSPRNPSDLVYNAVIPNDGGGLTATDQASAIVTAANIKKDFWDTCLRKWFNDLLNLNKDGRNGIGATPEAEANMGGEGLAIAEEAVQQALNRFEPLSGKYFFGKPLSLDTVAVDINTVADNLSRFLSQECRETTLHHTFWDKLVEMAGSLMFAVVPLIDRCLVVPWTPLLRDPWKYGAVAGANCGFKPRMGMPRLLRGVGIYGGRNWDTYSEGQGQPPVDMQGPGIGGVFKPYNTGHFEYFDAPKWMASIDLSFGSDGPAGVGKVRGNAQDPGLGQAPKGKSPREQAINNATLMTRFATYMYGMEALKDRQSPLNSPLRFDVAPGSIIYIGQQGEFFAADGEDQLSNSMVGCVTTVSYVVDTKTPVAMTAFHISHLRSLGENQTPGTSLSRHPLWDKNWSGSTMSGDFS